MTLYCCIVNSHCEKGYVCFFYQIFLHFATATLLHPNLPGAHTLLSISSTPTLHEPGKLTVGHAASQWEEVAPHLVVESCGVCKFGSGHLDEASRGVLSRWLKGESDTHIAKKTMCSVLEPQEANGNIPLAEQLKFFEESSGEPVTSLASLPGMYTCVCVCVCVCVHMCVCVCVCVLTECTVLVTIKFPLEACT